jgi:hypothetical protein
MTQYEKLSLLLLENIAQGVSLLNESQSLSNTKDLEIDKSDLALLMHKHRESLNDLVKQFVRLHELVCKAVSEGE